MRSIKLLYTVFFISISISLNAQTIPRLKVEQLVNYFSKQNDTVYVINFWATFCKPCVKEIPYLQSISKKYVGKKVKLLLVSLDLPDFYPGKMASFAEKNNITADIVWLDETNADHFCPLIDKKWSGSIPSTLFINPATGYRKFFEEAMEEKAFEAAIVELIKN